VLRVRGAWFSLLVLCFLSGCGGGSTVNTVNKSSPRLSDARQLAAMTPFERLRMNRPANLVPGTRVYHPVSVQLQTPTETLVVDPESVLGATNSAITVKVDGKPRVFSLATTKVTYGAQVQELFVPPGKPVPQNAGPLVETIR
jgi:hypothetical protein